MRIDTNATEGRLVYNPAQKNGLQEMKIYEGDNGPLIIDEVFFSREAIEQRKQDFAAKLNEQVEIDPFDNEFQIAAVKFEYPEGTLEKFITDALDGKAKNSSLVAYGLAELIRGTITNPNATIEERAINREIGLKNAEYIVKTYFENPAEAKAFLDEVKKFAEKDILREKGYIVLDNSNVPPHRPYELANMPKMPNPEADKRFDENAKLVADIINKAKAKVKEADANNSLQRLLKAF